MNSEKGQDATVPFRYASLCDGIGAVHVAWEPLGWECAWTAEIEPFPAAVVEHHWHLPNLGDITRITDEQIEAHGPVDLVVGGTPCQSFSVAGLRKGLADPRGNLALVFLGLVERVRPKWVVWENVPGILSDKTRALHSFLDGLEEVGYAIVGIDILDARFFGVPQRRRRVFVCAQSIEDLLTTKTPFSGLIAAQCLAEIWRHALGVLIEQSKADVGKWASSSSEHARLLQKRIRLFDLLKSEQVSRLLDCLDALQPSCVCEPGDLACQHGKSLPEGCGTIRDTRSVRSSEKASDTIESPNTEPSWKSILAAALRTASECITSIATSETIGSKISTCAQAVLTIAAFMRQSMVSFPGFLISVSSTLTALREYIGYARLANENLFDPMGRVGGWSDFLRAAERSADALGSLRVEPYQGHVLSLSESLCGNPPPSREARAGVARSLACRARGGGFPGTDEACDGFVQPVSCPETSPAMKARDYKGPSSDGDGSGLPLIPVTHPPRADGFDASEDGTGRWTPIVPVDLQNLRMGGDVAGTLDTTRPTRGGGQAVAFSTKESGKDATEGVSPTLRAENGDPHMGGRMAVAFSCKDSGQDAGETAPTLRAMEHDGSHANGGGQVAVALAQNQRGELRTSDVHPQLTCGGGKPGEGYPCVAFQERGREGGRSLETSEELAYALLNPGKGGRSQELNVALGYAVRRLTPRECERLMGMPDDMTLIPYRGKPAADGPRYRALGNSMATNCIRWLGRRIQMVKQAVEDPQGVPTP